MANNASGVVKFSRAEARKTYLVQEPHWCRIKLSAVNHRTSAAGDSVNHFCKFSCVPPAEQENQEMKDLEIDKLMNDKNKNLSRIDRFFLAAYGLTELDENGEYSFDDCKDIEIEGYIQRGKDQNGNTINDITDFRPVQQ